MELPEERMLQWLQLYHGFRRLTWRSSVSEAVITAYDDIGLMPIDQEIADTIDWSRHACKRTCRNDTLPLNCYYTFKLESYETMSKACYECPFNITDCFRPHCIPADGIMRSVLVVNRQLPGPPIEVRYFYSPASRAIVRPNIQGEVLLWISSRYERGEIQLQTSHLHQWLSLRTHL